MNDPRIARVSTFWGNTLLDVSYGGSLAAELASGAPPGESRALKIGALTYFVDWVRAGDQLAGEQPFDWRYPWVVCVSGLLHLFFVVAALITPPERRDLLELAMARRVVFRPPHVSILKPPPKEEKKPAAQRPDPGMKARREEGKVGSTERPPEDAARSRDGAPRVDPHKRERDRELAMNAGLLGNLRSMSAAGAVSNVLGPGGLGNGINAAMGGIRGPVSSDAGGAGGLGSRGWGPGGGGEAINIGGLATYGNGRDTAGYASIQLRGGARGHGTVRPTGVKVLNDGLPREDIARVIRRNLARFKYCYERELNANPNLSGKVSVRFTIGPNGRVAETLISESTIESEVVEDCVRKVMGTLEFPKPRGGGIVIVSYPFLFETT